MRAQVIAALALCLAGWGQQAPNPAPAAQPAPTSQLDSMKQHAAAAKPEEQVKEYIAIFEQEIEFADRAYNDGDADHGLALVNDAVADAARARDAAFKSRKLIKKLELHVRKSARRLEEIRRSLAFEDRAPVAKAVEQMEDISRELLAKMFAQ